jgi:hypothetical protein
MTSACPPTPIPSPQRGTGGAPARPKRPTDKSKSLPPPAVGEGWGGGCTPALKRTA